MRRRFGFAGGVLALTWWLAGCAGLPVAGFEVTPGFEPTSLGFEVDDDGSITVAAHTVTFVSERGSAGGVVTGYEIQYLDGAGAPLVPGSSGIAADHSLNVEVPPGFVCESTDPCTIVAEDARYARQTSEPMSGFVTLPGPVAIELLERGDVAGQAVGTFFATSDNGRDYEIDFTVPIQYPVEP